MTDLPTHLLKALRAGANKVEYIRLKDPVKGWPSGSYWVADPANPYAGGQWAGHVNALELRGLLEWVDGSTSYARITSAGQALLVSLAQTEL